MEHEDEQIPSDVLLSTALQVGICDALRAIGVVIASDERSRELLKEAISTLMTVAPGRLGAIAESPEAMESYKQPLLHLIAASDAREAEGEQPPGIH